MAHYFVSFPVLLLYLGLIYGFRVPKTSRQGPHCPLNMLMPVGGSNVALITPMKSDGSVDLPSLTKLCEWHVGQGTDGIVLLGTTGEGSTINREERRSIIQATVSAVGGTVPIIVGTGTIDPVTALALTQCAKDCGADASLVITPYYVKPPQRAMVKHFTDLADAVDLPMILYNCPGRTGIDMSVETTAIVSKHPGIIGVKDASGDLSRVGPLREQCGPAFLLYSGEDNQGASFVGSGGDGVISVTANVCPALEHEMLVLAKAGDVGGAAKIDEVLAPVHSALFLESNPIPVKRAVEMMQRIEGGIRPPLAYMDDAPAGMLRKALISAGAIEA